MAVKSNKKKEMLLNSFEVIKDDFKNKEAMEKAVCAMLSFDKETAKEMWLFLLEKYEKEIKSKGDDANYLTEYIACTIYDKYKGCVDEIILNTPKIKNAVFSHGGDDFCWPLWIIYDKMKNDDYSTANELLDMMYHNKNRSISWYEIMNELIGHYWSSKVPDETYDLLSEWCDKVKSKEDKAKITIKLLELA